MEERGSHLCSIPVPFEEYQGFSSFQIDPPFSTYLAPIFRSLIHISKLKINVFMKIVLKNKNALG